MITFVLHLASCSQSSTSYAQFIDTPFCEDTILPLTTFSSASFTNQISNANFHNKIQRTEAINRSASKKQVINRSASVIFRVVSQLYYDARIAYQ